MLIPSRRGKGKLGSRSGLVGARAIIRRSISVTSASHRLHTNPRAHRGNSGVRGRRDAAHLVSRQPRALPI